MALYTSISVSPSSREINGTNAFTVNIAFSSTASQLKETKIEVAGQTYSIGTVTSSSFTWTPPQGLLSAMASMTSATVIVSGQPANSSGFSLVDRISAYATVTVPASYVPTAPKNVTLTRVDNGVPPAWGLYVQNKSKLNVSWAAASGTGGARRSASTASIPTPGGKTQWRSNVVLSILQKREIRRERHTPKRLHQALTVGTKPRSGRSHPRSFDCSCVHPPPFEEFEE